MVVFMRRTDLEKKLRDLGYESLGQVSGNGHTAWYSRFGRVSVPASGGDHLILDSVANDILKRARAFHGEEE